MEFLKYINGLSTKLEKAATWQSSKTLIAEVETTNKKSARPNFVYEFYCLIRVISDLTIHQDIELKYGIGKYRLAFPRGPAPKKGKPLFLAYKKSTKEIIFQICGGTKILKRTDGKSRAPDISFQKADSPDSPSVDDVFMIFDAKYCEQNSAKKSSADSQFSPVVVMIIDLEVKNNLPQDPPLVKFEELKGLYGNCILTNGGFFNNSHDYHQSHDIKVVYNFEDGKQHKIIG